MLRQITMIAVFALATGALFGQGSGSTGGSAPGAMDAGSPFRVTKVVKGHLVKVEDEEEIVIESEGKEMSLSIARYTKLKADKRADIGDRKSVSLSDLKKGLPLRVKYTVADMTAVEIRVLKSPKG